MSSKTAKIAYMVEKEYETCYSNFICKDISNYHIFQSIGYIIKKL